MQKSWLQAQADPPDAELVSVKNVTDCGPRDDQ